MCIVLENNAFLGYFYYPVDFLKSVSGYVSDYSYRFVVVVVVVVVVVLFLLFLLFLILLFSLFLRLFFIVP